MLCLIHTARGITFKKKKRGGGAIIMVLRIKENMFPNTPYNFIQMILNNLQKTKKMKSEDKEKVSRKILVHVPTSAKHNGIYKKSKYHNLSKKNVGFLRQWKAWKTTLFKWIHL